MWLTLDGKLTRWRGLLSVQLMSRFSSDSFVLGSTQWSAEDGKSTDFASLLAQNIFDSSVHGTFWYFVSELIAIDLSLSVWQFEVKLWLCEIGKGRFCLNAFLATALRSQNCYGSRLPLPSLLHNRFKCCSIISPRLTRTTVNSTLVIFSNCGRRVYS